MEKSTSGLGVPQFLKGVTPDLEAVSLGWYESGRKSNRADGRPSGSDFLPAGLLTNQSKEEDFIMMNVSVKTPGATLGGKATDPRRGLNNLNRAGNTGSKAPNPGNSLK